MRLRKRRLLAAILTVILLLLGTAYWGYAKYMRIRNHIVLAQWHLHNIETMVKESPTSILSAAYLEAMRGEFAGAEREFAGLEREVRLFLGLSSFGRGIPYIGSGLEVAPHLLPMAIDLSAAGRLTTEGLYPLAALAEEKPLSTLAAEGSGDRVLEALAAGRPSFLEAQTRLQRAAGEWKAVDQARLPAQLAGYVELVDAYLPILQGGLQALEVSPDLADGLLGISEPKTLMIVMQNSHELRATGGIISAMGFLHLDRGKITQWDFYDPGAFYDPAERYPPPPEALFNYMWAGLWLLSDANWYPDFPTSAQIIEGLYKLGQKAAVDGIMAVDETALKYILEAVGPVYLQAYDEQVRAENVLQKMHQYHDQPFRGQAWLLKEKSAEEWAVPARKLFVGELFSALIARVQGGMGTTGTVRLLAALQRGLDEKHILLYLHDSAASAFLKERNWAGNLRQAEQDYLMVVDSNVGYNKINPNIEVTIDYQVELNPAGGGRGKLTITYHNQSTRQGSDCIQKVRPGSGYEEMMQGCYWNYLRVYVPQGSSLVQATRIPLPEGSLLSWMAKRTAPAGPSLGPAEMGKDVFGQFFVVAPGENRQVSFEYQLPGNVFEESSERKYSLLVQKQPGTLAVPVHVTVLIPAGMEMTSAQPEPARVSENQVEYVASLVTDQLFELTLAGQPRYAREQTTSQGPGASPPAVEATSFPIGISSRLVTTPTPRPLRLPPAKRIVIPAIGVDAKVVEVGWKVVEEKGQTRVEWETASYAVGHHMDSANPGEKGNVVMSGHHNIKGEVFRDLSELKAGHEIFLFSAADEKYRYVVQETLILLEKGASLEERRAHARYMDPTPDATLTLISCWPYWDNTHRVIVIAKQQE